MYGYGAGWGQGFGLGGALFGGIFMIIFWGLVIWAIVALVRGFSGGGCSDMSHSNRNGQKTDNAMNILKERYAKGEISKEDFEKMKNDLQ